MVCLHLYLVVVLLLGFVTNSQQNICNTDIVGCLTDADCCTSSGLVPCPDRDCFCNTQATSSKCQSKSLWYANGDADATNYVAQLTADLKNIKTNSASLSPAELNEIATQMATDSPSPDEMSRLLIRFYSLNAADVELVLKSIRELNLQLAKANDQDVTTLLKDEPIVQKALTDCNKASIAVYQVPFHLAVVRNENANFVERILTEAGLSGPNGAAGVSGGKTRDCPTGVFPYYFSFSWPWRLRNAWHTETWRRTQDSGCNFKHGPFNGNIRNWFSLNPQIHGMVLANAWGYKLAGDNKDFWYKWWTLIPFGLTPWHCQIFLQARVY